LGLKTIDGRFLEFGPQNPFGVPVGMGGCTWHHREACVEAKHSREEPVAIRCLDLKLYDFAPRLSGLVNISKALLGVCNSSINKRIATPNHPISLVVISLSFQVSRFHFLALV